MQTLDEKNNFKIVKRQGDWSLSPSVLLLW